MKNKNIFIYLISATLCTLPLSLFVNTIFFILLTLYTIFYVISNKIKPHFSRESFMFILFYLLMVLSYFWSINKPLSLLGLERKVAFLLMPLLFAFIPKFTPDEGNKIFHYFSLAITIYALFFIAIGIGHYFSTGDLKNLSHHKLVSPLKLSRIYVSLFSAVAFFYLVFNEKKGKNRTISLSILALFLILLSSKTIIITTLVTLLGFQFFKKRKLRQFKWQHVLYLFFVVGVLVVSNKVNPKFLSELLPRYKEVITTKDFKKNYYFNGSELRILYTRFLFEYEIEENIFFKGFGINATQQKINEKCEKYRVPEGYGNTFNFHNQYNQTLAEIGVFGLLILLYLLFLGFKNVVNNNNNFGLAVFIIFSAILATESVFNRQRGIYFFSIIFLLLININYKNFKSDKPFRSDN